MNYSCLIIVSSLILFCSCQKELPELPPPVEVPYLYTPNDSLSDAGPIIQNTQWIIYQYRIGALGGTQVASDTLEFRAKGELIYNGYVTKYASYYTLSGINLTFYESAWGAISGEIFSYNIKQGKISGTAFRNILNPTTQPVFLWINKLK